MKLSPNHFVIGVLALAVVGLSVCLFVGDGAEPPAPASVQVVRETKYAPLPDVPPALERALRRRISQLEAELKAARDPASWTNAPKEIQTRVMARQEDFRPPSPREMMENMKKNDPKRYEKFQTHFREMRKRQMARTKGRLEFLSSIDTTGMTKEERQNHQALQDLLAQRENLPEPTEETTEEEMRASMQQRRELDRAIRETSQTERKTLLSQTAKALGFEGDDATLLTEAVGEIIQATESGRGGPHGPPPGDAPGGAPGGGR